MKYIQGFFWIFLFTCLGELAHDLIPFPIPSGIYGLFFLLLALKTHLVPFDVVHKPATFMIEIMPLLFLPPGVGLIKTWHIIKPSFWALLCICIISTFIIFGVTGRVAQRCMPKEVKQ